MWLLLSGTILGPGSKIEQNPCPQRTYNIAAEGRKKHKLICNGMSRRKVKLVRMMEGII